MPLTMNEFKKLRDAIWELPGFMNHGLAMIPRNSAVSIIRMYVEDEDETNRNNSD